LNAINGFSADKKNEYTRQADEVSSAIREPQFFDANQSISTATALEE